MDLAVNDLPNDPDALRAMIATMRHERVQIEAEVAELNAINARIEERNGRLASIIKMLTRGRFGQKSEKLKLAGVTDEQLDFVFDELETAEPESLCLPVPRDRRLRMMAAAIAADPSSKESLASWGARIGMSERGLTRQFRVETGMSFVQWRSMARMKRALEMLAGGATVTDTALDLGYDSASSFIALFRRTFGVTPARQGFPQSGGSRPLQRPYGG